jgi:hypothetical protein
MKPLSSGYVCRLSIFESLSLNMYLILRKKGINRKVMYLILRKKGIKRKVKSDEDM